jgi:hypothetical protein
MTEEHITAYQAFMTLYLQNFAILYPELHFRPNHHMAMHIPDFLRLFGPVRSWWCFPFERLIGSLQRLPTNQKLGMQVCVLSKLVLTRLPRRDGGDNDQIFHSSG